MGTLLTGKWLLDGTGAVKENWGVAFEESRILAVGSNEQLLADRNGKYAGFDHIDCGDKIISPGFVNAHMHSYGILSHGITPPVEIDSFETFLNGFWWPLVEDQLDPEMIAAAGRATAYEMLSSGITSFCDILEAPNAVPGGLAAHAKVLEEIGMRATLSIESCERPGYGDGMAALNENLEFFKRFKDHPLVSGMMCIHTTFTCSKEYIRKAADIAREAGSGIQMHLSESKYEPEWCLKHHGQLPVELYEELGYLGTDVLASQGVKLTPGEIEILAEKGVRLVHVPLSNCEVGGGFSPVPDLIAAGVPVGLGTDGYINNFFETMRGAFLFHKANRENAEVMPGDVVYKMATINGGRAVGNPGLGILKEGAEADIITVDASFPTPVNRENIYNQFILYRNPDDVKDVYVAGKLVKSGGTLLNFDADAVRSDVMRAAERLWKAGRE